MTSVHHQNILQGMDQNSAAPWVRLKDFHREFKGGDHGVQTWRTVLYEEQTCEGRGSWHSLRVAERGSVRHEQAEEMRGYLNKLCKHLSTSQGSADVQH